VCCGSQTVAPRRQVIMDSHKLLVAEDHHQHTPAIGPDGATAAVHGFQSPVGAFGSLGKGQGASPPVETWKKLLAAGCLLLIVLLVAAGIVLNAKKVGVSCEVTHCNDNGECKKDDDGTFRTCDCDRSVHIVGRSCACESGWAGRGCEHQTGCDGAPCAHGTCTAVGGDHTCACASGWKGLACNQGTGCDSNPDCGKGTCVANGGAFACTCQANYYGQTCAKFCAKTGTCSGRCTLTEGACSCQPNYYGPTCATFCSATTTCSGHGSCGSDGASCRCQTHYYGQSCATLCLAANTCSGHGFCGSDGRCDCQGGYTRDKHCRGAEHKLGHCQCMHFLSL
jgi:hypothetical protein